MIDLTFGWGGMIRRLSLPGNHCGWRSDSGPDAHPARSKPGEPIMPVRAASPRLAASGEPRRRGFYSVCSVCVEPARRARRLRAGSGGTRVQPMNMEKSVRAGLAATAAVLLIAGAHVAGAAGAGAAGSGAAAAGAAGAGAAAPAPSAPQAPLAPHADGRESHLADLLMLTHGGQNAEAYWSPDGR